MATIHQDQAPATAPPPDGLTLDGGADVVLAPVRGRDTRRALPNELFERRPARFVAKFSVAAGLLAASTALLATGAGAGTVPAVVVAGVMFAHLVELQHETLHEHAFRSRRLNRAFGVVCGLFMFSSYSHYKYHHLRHHAFLGTPRNHEFFGYRSHRLDTVGGFVAAATSLARYREVARHVACSVLGRPIPGVGSNVEARKIRAEYRGYLAVLLAAVAAAVATGSPLALLAWFVPALLVAEPVHFLVELPEHFGLDTQNEPDVAANSRTVQASRFGRWLTNGNNLHTAHHFHQGVPMTNLVRLHELHADRFTVVEPSYRRFFAKVLRGELVDRSAAGRR